LALVKTHRPAFQDLAASQLKPAAGGVKPFEHLIHIVGQLASSAQYLSRTAATTADFAEHLKLNGASEQARLAFTSELSSQRFHNLQKILSQADQNKAILSDVAFLQETNAWLGQRAR
jgi:hypothetical protein